MRYRSKKDPGLVALTWGGVPIPFVPALLLLILPIVLPGVPSRNSPAWSLDRLQVDYHMDGRERFVLISPEDQLGFMQKLAENSQELEVRDGCVVRHR